MIEHLLVALLSHESERKKIKELFNVSFSDSGASKTSKSRHHQIQDQSLKISVA